MNVQVQQAPEPVHVVALSGCRTLADKIRYACEHNRPAPTADTVLHWLARYGVTAPFTEVSGRVNKWRAEHSLPPTDISTTVSTRHGRVTDDVVQPAGVTGFYLAAALSMVVSIDTSWRFFTHNLHITNMGERAVMFTVLEVALVACGYGMRANVHRFGRPGAPRLFAWLLCAMAGYMAWQLSGVAEGIARVALGPLLGLVMLHLALGIEIRARRDPRTSVGARIGRELRERLLSRFGLADDERDAVARTRDRAARRVARLSLGRVVVLRSVRLARALRASNVAHDPAGRERMLTELAAVRHAADLATLDQPSPWHPRNSPANSPANTAATTAARRSVNTAVHGCTGAQHTNARPRSGGRRKLADYLAEARVHLGPGVVVTPAWVRSVIPGCPRSTSKNVADALTRPAVAVEVGGGE